MKKNEIIFIGVILIIAAGLWGVLKLRQPDAYKSIHITVGGEEFGSYSLDEDQIIKIGNTNVAEIKNHQIQMIEAKCPDQLCIYQGPISSRGGMIVCLPNQIFIEGENINDDSSGVDTIAS